MLNLNTWPERLGKKLERLREELERLGRLSSCLYEVRLQFCQPVAAGDIAEARRKIWCVIKLSLGFHNTYLNELPPDIFRYT